MIWQLWRDLFVSIIYSEYIHPEREDITLLQIINGIWSCQLEKDLKEIGLSHVRGNSQLCMQSSHGWVIKLDLLFIWIQHPILMVKNIQQELLKTVTDGGVIVLNEQRHMSPEVNT